MRLALVKQFGARSGWFDHPVYRSLAYPLTGVLWLIDEAIQTLSLHQPMSEHHVHRRQVKLRFAQYVYTSQCF